MKYEEFRENQGDKNEKMLYRKIASNSSAYNMGLYTEGKYRAGRVSAYNCFTPFSALFLETFNTSRAEKAMPRLEASNLSQVSIGFLREGTNRTRCRDEEVNS